MANKTDEEHLENPVNNQPEIPADQIISPTDSETINPNKETENMEVHHHAHHEGKKNWKSYFWEFLMLFLAVFCGFLAEYQLEHKIENDREKKYIRSFIEDLKSDTLFIDRYLNSKEQKIKEYDSLIRYLNSSDPDQFGTKIYFLARQLTRIPIFTPADGTIKQLINSGGLRLIKNQQVSDSIMAYNQATNRILLTQTRQEGEIAEIRILTGKLLDPNILETMVDGEKISPPDGNPALRTRTKEFILDFIYAVHQLKGSDKMSAVRLNRLKERAYGIILFLKTEYNIQ